MSPKERVDELDYALHCLAQAAASLRRAGVSGAVAVAERLQTQVGFVRSADSMLARLDAAPVVSGNFEADVCKAEADLRAGARVIVPEPGVVDGSLDGLPFSLMGQREGICPWALREGFQLCGDGCGGVEVLANE